MLNLSISPGGGIHGLLPVTPAPGPFLGIVPQLSRCRQDRHCPGSACRNGRCGCYWDNDCRNDKCCDKSDYSDIPGRCNRDCYSGTTPPPPPSPPPPCFKDSECRGYNMCCIKGLWGDYGEKGKCGKCSSGCYQDSDCRGYNMCCINGLSNYPFPSPWNGRGQGQCGKCTSECSVKRSCGPGKYCNKGVCEPCKNECSGSSGCGKGKCCTTIYDGPCGERSFVNHVKNPLILLQLKNAILIVSVEMANAARLAFPFPISQSHSPCPQDQEFVFPAHREVAPMIGIVERMHAAWRECVPQMD